MNNRSAWAKLPGILLSLALIFTTAPFSLAEASAADPLGSIISTGLTVVGNSAAPTGTTIFAGDRVRSDDPVLISLNSGSRIEMTKATANFDRKGDALVLQVDEGLLRFNFDKEESVEIEAGDYRFMASGDSGPTGELGINHRGQIAMNLMEGSFQALNTTTGKRTEVSIATPFAIMDQTGRGRIVNDGKTITDDFLSVDPNSLQGQCVVAGSEAYAISNNSGNLITINGNWDLGSGDYTYQVVECTEEAMVQAGASREAAENAVVASVFGVTPAAQESHVVRNAAIIAGVAGAVVVPLAIKAMGDDEKSPSSP